MSKSHKFPDIQGRAPAKEMEEPTGQINRGLQPQIIGSIAQRNAPDPESSAVADAAVAVDQYYIDVPRRFSDEELIDLVDFDCQDYIGSEDD